MKHSLSPSTEAQDRRRRTLRKKAGVQTPINRVSETRTLSSNSESDPVANVMTQLRFADPDPTSNSPPAAVPPSNDPGVTLPASTNHPVEQTTGRQKDRQRNTDSGSFASDVASSNKPGATENTPAPASDTTVDANEKANNREGTAPNESEPAVPEHVLEWIATINALRKIPRVCAIKLLGAVDEDPVETIDIVSEFQNNPVALERILKVMLLPSHDTLSNLAFTDPKYYKHVVQGQVNRIVKGSGRYPHSFFTVGVCSYSELVTAGPNSRGRQISVIPLKGIWNRSAAVLHAIFDLPDKNIRFAIHSGGVNFSTVRASAATLAGGATSTPQKYATRRAVNGKSHGDATRPWDEDVPLFDGRSNFRYKQYHKLPTIDTELEEGDVVFVIFTANLWGDAVDRKPSLNVQVVVKVQDAAKRKDKRKPAEPLPEYLAMFQDFGLQGAPLPDVANEFSDDDDDDGGI